MTTYLIRGLYNLSPDFRGSVVTIGNFDGVHIGHQALLDKVKEKAKSLKVRSIVVTFEPQPAEYFAEKNSITPRLMRWREKFHALAKSGIDAVLVLRFNKQLAKLSAEEFIRRILSEGLGTKHVIVGDDFRFGRNRQGDFDYLKTLGQTYGFAAESMSSVMLDGKRVSSTRIRLALQDNQNELAEKMLGHPYYMEGRVVYGDKRGRTIGFPTANIFLHRKVTPLQGVYAVRVFGICNGSLTGIANIGIRPTVDGTRSLLEVHLFDFDQDIYKKHVRVEFWKKLRDEKRFDSFELLKQQIFKDAEEARVFFEKPFKG